MLLKQCPLISELRLYDKDDSICVVAEDLSHIDTKTKVKSYCGISVLKHAVLVIIYTWTKQNILTIFFLQDSDLVLSVGGCRRKVSECPKTLFERNLDDVLSATMHCIEFNPKVVFCVAKPPIEAFVPLISEVSHHLSTIIITKLITIHGIIHYYLFPT